MSDALSMQLIFGGMFAVFMVMLGIPMVVFLRAALKATTTNRWPATEGHVVSSDVTSHRTLDSNGTHTTIYEPAIVYEYNAGGQVYQSKQLSYSAVDGASAEGWAESIAGKYPAGSPVRVFYNPHKPGEAVLEHAGVGGNLILAVIMGVVELILAGVCLAVVFPSK